MSFTTTGTRVFSVTDARYVASKVKADLAQMRLYYGAPSEVQIERYGLETELLLVKGYLGVVTYGFRRGKDHVPPTLKYTARTLLTADDLPGRVWPGENIAGATFYSYLTYSNAWLGLTLAQREQFEATLPFVRSGAQEPGASAGIWVNGKSYSSGGGGVERSVLRST